MIGESYDLIPGLEENRYWFASIGNRGTILKEVVYQKMKPGKYNLAFGDVIGGRLRDEVISNNLDFVKVMNTVVKTVYDFTEKRPNVVIQIKAVDGKRLRFYNLIIKRHWKEIDEHFSVRGKRGKRFESYREDQFYQAFEVKRKNLNS